MAEGDEKVKQDLKDNTYVDNVMGLVSSKVEAEKFKVESTEIMAKGKFPLGKWESNINVLNDNDKVETKLLGILWNKCDDVYAVEIEVRELETVTKRLMLKTLASIYDPLGIISPMLVEGKHLYREAVDERKGWDKQVSEELSRKWNKWVKSLQTVKVPRSIAPYLEDVIQVSLHHFMDASDKAVSAQTVAVVTQSSGITQGLLTSKSRITKRGLTTPRQELVGCQMGANLAVNTRKSLKNLPVTHNYCWTDNTVALCWVKNPFKNWKAFVPNRVRKIYDITQELNLEWRYVPTKLNHSDLGSRGASYDQLERSRWWEGPDWLKDETQWPSAEQETDESADEIKAELKAKTESLFCVKDDLAPELDGLLIRKTLKGAKRVLAWGFRFLHNARNKKHKISGPLTTQELEKADTCLIRRSQTGVDLESKEAQQLGLTQFEDHVIRCVGRISGEQPIFIPRNSIYCDKLTAEVHKKVGHKGVNMMMAVLREKFWIPRLRAVLKKLKRACETCRIMTTQPYPRPSVGRLPDYRTTASYPFAITGVDFVGPFFIKADHDQQDNKAYIVIFSCGTSRAVHFTTTRTMLASEFIDRLNEFIAARSRPKRMISDNAQTFKATAEFIRNLRKSEELHEYLAEHEIQWEFILTKSPWRGAFYERLNRDLKKMLYQKLGRSYLTFSGFSRVVKDI